MSKDFAISFRGVSFSYPKTQLLEKVTMEIPARQINCLVGPNGGGKSTILKLILGLIEPQAGEIKVLGMEPKKAVSKIGYMPQLVQFDPLFPITVEEIVRMGRLKRNRFGFFSSYDKKIAERSLEEVGLNDVRKESFNHLSGGMKQRVLIARALAVEPELLLLDEPTAMVDARIEAQLLAKIKELHNRMTILLVSHDSNFVSGLVDRVFCVNQTIMEHPVSRVSDDHIIELYGEAVNQVQHHHHHD